MIRSRLTMVQCGHCRQLAAATMKGAPWRIVDFPSLVGVIRHPTRGVVLFDTGYDAAFMEATRPFPERLYRWATPVTIPTGSTAVEKLAGMGISPDQVAHVVISHFHGDHVSGLHRFPNARLHCARAGLSDVRARGRISRTRHGILSSVIPSRIDGAAFFEEDAIVQLPGIFFPFERGADVLGDGSLVAVELPGHCPGHWGLALRLEDDRHAMLVADVAWSLDAIERNVAPPRATSSLLGDAHAAARTLASLHLMAGRTDLSLLPSHCGQASRAAGLLA
jgi:glyoxylase-like metal-dependent hydrolase (beta-lactamase superfamily II)